MEEKPVTPSLTSTARCSIDLTVTSCNLFVNVGAINAVLHRLTVPPS